MCVYFFIRGIQGLVILKSNIIIGLSSYYNFKRSPDSLKNTSAAENVIL